MIHQLYRIQYIREVVLTTVVDDMLMNSIGTIISHHQTNIIEIMKEDDCFLMGLITKLANTAELDTNRLDCMKCLLELCKLAALTNASLKVELHRKLCQFNVFRIAEPSLSSINSALRSSVLNVLVTLLDQEPSMKLTLGTSRSRYYYR